MHSLHKGLRPFRITYFVYILQSLCLSFQYAQGSYKQESSSYYHASDQQSKANSKPENLLDGFAYTSFTDESKLRLALLVDDKIDSDKDGLIQLDELVSWLRHCQDKYAVADVNRQWISLGKSSEDISISWEEYKVKEYDNILSLTRLEHNLENAGLKSSHDIQLRGHQRRWEAADSDHDGRLSKEEYKSFIYPEQNQQMHESLAKEKFDTLDEDRDNRISFGEYIASVPNDNGPTTKRSRGDWVKRERTRFYELWDANRDGHLDKSEVFSMLSKSEWDDHTITEAQHLMRTADTNGDHRLSKEEILAAYDEFINSHVTDFGEALKNNDKFVRDEL